MLLLYFVLSFVMAGFVSASLSIVPAFHRSHQRQLLAAFHGSAFRLCLVNPSHASNVAALVETEDAPFPLCAEERDMRHLARRHSFHYTMLLLRRLRVRSHSALDALADKFEDLTIGPRALPPMQPPHSFRSPLRLYSDLQGTRKKVDFQPALLQSLVAERFEEIREFLQAFTDGSVLGPLRRHTIFLHLESNLRAG